MVDSIYYLKPNYDSSQDMAWPEGDKPDAPNLPPPAVQDLSAAETGPYNIELDWTTVAGATYYNVQRSPDNAIWSDIGGVAAPPYNSGSLTPNTKYYYRIFSENTYGWGLVSNTAFATTDSAAAPGAGQIFYDDFNSYTVGDSVVNKIPPIAAAGVKWNWNSGSPVRVGTGGMDGGNCLDFNFKSADDQSDNSDLGHSYCEQQMRLCDGQATAHRELWLEFYLKTTNVARAGTSNDKFCAFHNVNYCDGGRAAYGRGGMYTSTWYRSGNNYYPDIILTQYKESGAGYDPWAHPYADGGVPPYGIRKATGEYDGPYSDPYGNFGHADRMYNENHRLITADQAGTWVRYRVNMRQPSLTQPDGHGKIWKDNVLMYDIDQMWRDSDYSYHQFMDGIYLLGYFNNGFVTPTTWKMDKVSVWASDPGWTF